MNSLLRGFMISMLLLGVVGCLFAFGPAHAEEEMVILQPQKYFKKSLINQDFSGYTEAFMRFKPKLTAVLVFYGVEIRYDINRRILIPKTIAEDEGFMLTALIKCQDNEWLNRHIYLSPDSTRQAY